MATEIIEVVLKTDGAVDNATEVKDKIEDIGDEAEKSGKKVDKSAKKSKKSLGVLKKGAKGVGTAVKGIGTAMKLAGIGLLVSVVAGFFSVLSENQKVVDAINTVMNVFQLVFNAVTTAITDAYNSVKDATGGFDALKNVIKGLLTIAITPLKLAFLTLKGSIESLNVAYQGLFGDEESIKKARESLEETNKSIEKVVADVKEAGTLVKDNIGEAFDEVGTLVSAVSDEIKKIEPDKILESAKAMTELKNNSEVAVAVQAGLVEEYDRSAEKLRQIRDEERNTITDRIKANNDLLLTLDDMEESMLKQADLQIASAQANVLANDSIENQVALIDALNNRKGVLAQVEGLRSEQKANDLALDKERLDLTNSQNEAESLLSIERERFNAEQITDEQLKLQKLEEILAREKEMELERLESKKLAYVEGTQAYVDAQIELDAKKEEFRQAEVVLEGQKVASLKGISETEAKLEEDKRKSKYETLDAVTNIAGAETKIGKALLIFKQVMQLKESIMDALDIKKTVKKAISKTAINTAEGVGETAKIGFPQNIPALIGYGVQASSIISAMKKATKGAGGGLSVPNIKSSAPASAPKLPDFNIVGSSGTNQLAEAIGGQSQTPIKAYVTSTDISSQQELDNTIRGGAEVV